MRVYSQTTRYNVTERPALVKADGLETDIPLQPKANVFVFAGQVVLQANLADISRNFVVVSVEIQVGGKRELISLPT